MSVDAVVNSHLSCTCDSVDSGTHAHVHLFPFCPSMSQADWLATDHGIRIVVGHCDDVEDVPPSYRLPMAALPVDVVPGMGGSL